jgi:hypothetical protein
LSWLRKEGDLTEMAGIPWVRESVALQRIEPFQTTVCMGAFDHSARDPEARSIPSIQLFPEHNLVLSWLRIEDELTEMAGVPWVHKIPCLSTT